MEKLYTKEEYAQKAAEASAEGKMLYKVQKLVDYEVEVYEYEKKIIQVPVYNEKGEIIGYEEKEVDDLTKPIMIEVIDPVTGETILVHKHHTEVHQKMAESIEKQYEGYYICSTSNITDGTINPDFETNRINALRADLNEENTIKAKAAVEQGYVEFKEAQFETNAQTVGDLTATMLLMQASELESYQWLSKDDQIVELTLEDFGTLGGLIAGFKAHIWNEEYMGYKRQINNAQSFAELEAIVIEY